MRLIVLTGLCAVIALAAAVPAEARPKKKLRTVADQTIPNGVAVYRQAGSTAKDYWCNAGDFALRKMGAPSDGALELVRPEGAAGGPSDRDSIGFSLVDGGGGSGGVSVSTVGERHSLGQTKAFCLSQVDPSER
ncbi:MAG: hypothetical protein AAGB05_17810 [Pseudomonadota bacterium]